jgi:hypothetical protein
MKERIRIDGESETQLYVESSGMERSIKALFQQSGVEYLSKN